MRSDSSAWFVLPRAAGRASARFEAGCWQAAFAAESREAAVGVCGSAGLELVSTGEAGGCAGSVLAAGAGVDCWSCCWSGFFSCARPGKLPAITSRQVQRKPVEEILHLRLMEFSFRRFDLNRRRLASVRPKHRLSFASFLFCLNPGWFVCRVGGTGVVGTRLLALARSGPYWKKNCWRAAHGAGAIGLLRDSSSWPRRPKCASAGSEVPGAPLLAVRLRKKSSISAAAKRFDSAGKPKWSAPRRS